MAKRGRPPKTPQPPPTKDEIHKLLYPPGEDERKGYVELAQPKRGKGNPNGGPGRNPIYVLNKDTAEKFLYGLSYGLSLAKACKLVGLPASVITYWRSRAEKGREPYVEFFRQVDHTIITFELERIKMLTMMATGQWPYKHSVYAAMLPLERQRQEDWALKGSSNPVNVNIDHRSLIVEAERMAQEALERQAQEIRQIEATVVESKPIEVEVI